MIPIPFTEHHETTPALPHCGRRGWRWVFDAGRWQRGVYVSLDEQVIFHEHTDGWHNGNRYISLSLVRKFEVGEEHDYYDGPHCCRKLGWLRVNYSWNWCKKCMPGET